MLYVLYSGNNKSVIMHLIILNNSYPLLVFFASLDDFISFNTQIPNVQKTGMTILTFFILLNNYRGFQFSCTCPPFFVIQQIWLISFFVAKLGATNAEPLCKKSENSSFQVYTVCLGLKRKTSLLIRRWSSPFKFRPDCIFRLNFQPFENLSLKQRTKFSSLPEGADFDWNLIWAKCHLGFSLNHQNKRCHRFATLDKGRQCIRSFYLKQNF